MTRPLRIGHLYPEAMNIYGDMGNIRTLQRRAEWRGHAVETVPIGAGPADLEACDILFMGGGQDRDQSRIYADFADHKRGSLERGLALLPGTLVAARGTLQRTVPFASALRRSATAFTPALARLRATLQGTPDATRGLVPLPAAQLRRFANGEDLQNRIR